MLRKKLLAYMHYIQNQLMWFFGNPCYLMGITKTLINNYKIYGNSEQVGTPTPESPVEIKSVGDKTANIFDKSQNEVVQVTSEASRYGNRISGLSGTYTISQSSYPSADDGTYYRFYQDGTYGAGVSIDSAKTIFIPDGAVLIIHCGSKITQAAFDALNIMVTEGSTIPSSYEPYGYKIPVKVSKLPDEYTELKYIQSTGEQYIDIGLKSTANTKVKIVYTPIAYASSNNIAFYGAIDRNVGNFSGAVKSSGAYYINDASQPAGAVPPLQLNQKYEDINEGTKYTQNGVKYTVSPVTATNFNIFLFGRNASGTVERIGTLQVEEFKVWLDGVTLSCDLIPAKRNSDNVLGMYDLVTNTFFTNAGTGTFIAGAEVEPFYTTNVYLSQPLRSIGTYADYIDYENQKVYRQIGYKVLDGTEDWSLQQGTGYYRYGATIVQDSVTPTTDILCSHGKGGMNKGQWRIALGILMRYDNASTPDFASVNDFKTYLAQQYANGTPVTVIYPLSTPTEESIIIPQLNVPLGDSIVTTDTEVQASDIQIQGSV